MKLTALLAEPPATEADLIDAAVEAATLRGAREYYHVGNLAHMDRAWAEFYVTSRFSAALYTRAVEEAYLAAWSAAAADANERMERRSR